MAHLQQESLPDSEHLNAAQEFHGPSTVATDRHHEVLMTPLTRLSKWPI